MGRKATCRGQCACQPRESHGWNFPTACHAFCVISSVGIDRLTLRPPVHPDHDWLVFRVSPRLPEQMSNQQSRHIIAPTEYERNQAAISNYRQYLDLYEKLNEQGLKNHEEVERIEMLLQQRIQAGEEAKYVMNYSNRFYSSLSIHRRQLELLKQTTGLVFSRVLWLRGSQRHFRRLMLTDGAPVVPDLAAMAPSAPPVTLTTPQTSSSSAYIEEIHQEQMVLVYYFSCVQQLTFLSNHRLHPTDLMVQRTLCILLIFLRLHTFHKDIQVLHKMSHNIISRCHTIHPSYIHLLTQ